jgi:hypothetical protein
VPNYKKTPGNGGFLLLFRFSEPKNDTGFYAVYACKLYDRYDNNNLLWHHLHQG